MKSIPHLKEGSFIKNYTVLTIYYCFFPPGSKFIAGFWQGATWRFLVGKHSAIWMQEKERPLALGLSTGTLYCLLFSINYEQGAPFWHFDSVIKAFSCDQKKKKCAFSKACVTLLQSSRSPLKGWSWFASCCRHRAVCSESSFFRQNHSAPNWSTRLAKSQWWPLKLSSGRPINTKMPNSTTLAPLSMPRLVQSTKQPRKSETSLQRHLSSSLPPALTSCLQLLTAAARWAARQRASGFRSRD